MACTARSCPTTSSSGLTSEVLLKVNVEELQHDRNSEGRSSIDFCIIMDPNRGCYCRLGGREEVICHENLPPIGFRLELTIMFPKFF